jgi:ribosomal protein S12 methylthiotransferase accessory factor
MVHTNYTAPFPDGHGCFTASSNGLASGNHVLEAISHGICEVVERDATTLWKLRDEQKLVEGRLDLRSVDDRICQELFGKLERAGLTVAVWDITSEIELATFACFILPREDNGMWHCSVATGFGCHPARQVALIRALTEAAQSRLTIISGVRDDFGRDLYDQCLDSDLVGAIRDRMNASGETGRFCDVPNWDAETLEDDIERELECLRKAGVRQVVVVDLTKREFGLPVVRVIVPGLESKLVPGYTPGRRGQVVLEKQP